MHTHITRFKLNNNFFPNVVRELFLNTFFSRGKIYDIPAKTYTFSDCIKRWRPFGSANHSSLFGIYFGYGETHPYMCISKLDISNTDIYLPIFLVFNEHSYDNIYKDG